MVGAAMTIEVGRVLRQEVSCIISSEATTTGQFSCASEFEGSEILNNISVQSQRQLCETTTQFVGCESEEIEFGMSAFSNIYTKMDMENLFSEESVKKSEFFPSEQWHPSSLSSIQTSDDQYHNIKFPTMKTEDMIITSAISAIFSSNPSTSSILNKPLRKVQTNQSLGTCDSGFKPYNSAIPPESEPKKRSCGQKMIKDSIAYLRKINSTRDEAANQESQPTRHQLHHMISERKRREKLNKSFYELRLLLPPCSKDKASVLCKTKDYLKILEAQIFELEKNNQKLEMNLVPADETKEDVSRSICSKNVQIVEAFEPMIGTRQIVLKITVRLECDLVKLVLHALEYLKEIKAISLVSLYADTDLEQMVQFTRATLKFDIKASDWDEVSFKEGMTRAVDMATM